MCSWFIASSTFCITARFVFSLLLSMKDEGTLHPHESPKPSHVKGVKFTVQRTGDPKHFQTVGQLGFDDRIVH